jgi:hypothetical protein
MLLTTADDRIRAACMQQICEAALELPESVPAPLVLAVAKRTCDRKEHVMRDAVSRLCLLFRTHCLEHWRTARELPEASRRFLFLPKRLVAACTQVHRIVFAPSLPHFRFDELILILQIRTRTVVP